MTVDDAIQIDNKNIKEIKEEDLFAFSVVIEGAVNSPGQMVFICKNKKVYKANYNTDIKIT